MARHRIIETFVNFHEICANYDVIIPVKFNDVYNAISCISLDFIYWLIITKIKVVFKTLFLFFFPDFAGQAVSRTVESKSELLQDDDKDSHTVIQSK